MPTSDTSPMRTLCVVSALLLLPMVAMAQGAWKQLPGTIDGAWVSSIALYHGDTLFLGTSTARAAVTRHPVYRSTDNGVTWQPTQEGIDENTWLDRLAVYRGFVFACTGRGLYRSSDAGQTWQLLSEGLESANVSDVIAVDSTLYAATRFGVFKSTNNGDSWTDCSTGLLNEAALRLHRVDTVLIALTRKGVFRSTNAGARWSISNEGLDLDYNSIFDVISARGECFVAGKRSVYRSTNAGQSWMALGRGGSWHMFWLNSSLAVVSDSGLYRLRAGDTVRLPIETSLASSTITTSLINNGVLIVGTLQGVYRSAINDVAWTSSSNGMNEICIYALARQGTTTYAGTNRGVFRSIGARGAWISVGRIKPIDDVVAVGQDTVIATSSSSLNRSTDAGATWREMYALDIDQVYRKMYASYIIKHRNILLATGSDTLIYRSTDDGASWVQIRSGMPRNTSICSIVSNNRVVFIGLTNGLYRSNDDGSTWHRLEAVKWSASSIAACDSAIVICDQGRIYRSTDDGVTWTIVNAYLPNTPTKNSIKSRGNDVIIGTTPGVFISRDCGDSWTEFSDGIADRNITSIYVDGTTVYAGTSKGSIYVLDEDATSVGDATRHPDATSSAHNISVHPVPARDCITLTYRTAASEYVRIAVVGSNGEIVHHHTAHLQQGGEHTLDINTSTWATGVYSITVQTHRRAHSTPVMVVR